MCYLLCIYNGGSTATILSHLPENQAVHSQINVLQFVLENHKTLGEAYDNASEFEHLISQEEGTCGYNVLGYKKYKGIGYVSLTCHWSNLQHVTLSTKYFVISPFNASIWNMENRVHLCMSAWKLCIFCAKCLGKESREWSNIVYHHIKIFTFLASYIRIEHSHVAVSPWKVDLLPC